MTDSMQDLLNTEATLGNVRYRVQQQIKLLRGPSPPLCWGVDDCSTNIMTTCPWRIDCDSEAARSWQEKLELRQLEQIIKKESND